MASDLDVLCFSVAGHADHILPWLLTDGGGPFQIGGLCSFNYVRDPMESLSESIGATMTAALRLMHVQLQIPQTENAKLAAPPTTTTATTTAAARYITAATTSTTGTTTTTSRTSYYHYHQTWTIYPTF